MRYSCLAWQASQSPTKQRRCTTLSSLDARLQALKRSFSLPQARFLQKRRIAVACMNVGLIIVLPLLLCVLFSRTNDLMLVASTLVMAVLFQQVGQAIQQSIDLRFSQGTYDATQTLAAFSTRLCRRDHEELTTLTQDLLAVVKETMEPAYVSLWLRSPEHPKECMTCLLPDRYNESRQQLGQPCRLGDDVAWCP